MPITKESKNKINSEIELATRTKKENEEYKKILNKIKDILLTEYKIKAKIQLYNNGNCKLYLKRKFSVLSPKTIVAIKRNIFLETKHYLYCTKKYLAICVDELENSKLNWDISIEKQGILNDIFYNYHSYGYI